jgi:muramoyltetrapeptide carboxypeptidase
VHSLGATDEASVAHLFALLAGESRDIPGDAWVPGSAKGPIVGGNLTLIASTCGTQYQLDARGAILVLEDVGEHPYRLDRSLQQLRSAGVFEGVAGVGFGEFIDCPVPNSGDWTLKQVLMDHTAHLGVPIVGNLPIGHGSANRAFRIGSGAKLVNGTLSFTQD